MVPHHNIYFYHIFNNSLPLYSSNIRVIKVFISIEGIVRAVPYRLTRLWFLFLFLFFYCHIFCLNSFIHSYFLSNFFQIRYLSFLQLFTPSTIILFLIIQSLLLFSHHFYYTVATGRPVICSGIRNKVLWFSNGQSRYARHW